MAKAKVAVVESEQVTDKNTASEAAPSEKVTKAKAARGGTDKFVFQKDLSEGQKFAPQALLIVKHVKAHNTITRDQLCEELAKDPDFKTKQPIGRVVSYYQSSLISAGILSVEK